MSIQTTSVNVDADGFTRVVAKGKRGRLSKVPHCSRVVQTHTSKDALGSKDIDASPTPQTSVLPGKRRSNIAQQPRSTVDKQVADIKEKQLALKSDKFRNALQPCLDMIQGFVPEEIVCYGIGSLATQVSQWQLALVLLINEDRNIGMWAYDPVAVASDCETLNRFGVSIIAENEQAKRNATKRTLFFMPHCEEFLYNNVLAANWSPESLSRVVIIGNHLGRYKDTQSSEEFATKSPFIWKALSGVTCTDLPSEKLLGLRNSPFAFTDTCVQLFGTIDY